MGTTSDSDADDQGADRTWVGWVEDKKVLLTIFISVVALLAPTSSAVAAFLSWRTAQASEAVTRHAADTAGSILTINPIARLTGMCGADYDPLHIEVSVQNYGRLAGRILNLRLFVWMITPDGYRSTVVASAHSGPVEVAAMDSATASLQIDCDGLGRMMMTNPKNLVDGQPSVGLLLQSGMGDTFVEVQYPLRTSVHFPLEQVSR